MNLLQRIVDGLVRLQTLIVRAVRAIASVLILIVRGLVSEHRGRTIWLSRYTFLSMALGTVPLLAASQGRDLLLALGDDHGRIEHRVFFYITLALWGTSVWYWTRVVLDAEYQNASYVGLARSLPRIAGAATIVLPGIPILRADNDLWVKLSLSGGCVVLAGLFLWFVTARRNWASVRSSPAVPGFAFSAAAGRAAGRFARGSLGVSLALFVWFVFKPLQAGHHFGALAILFIAAANTVFFGSLAVFGSEAWKVRIDIIAMACAAAFSVWNDNHDVRSTLLAPVSTSGLEKAALPTLQESYETWRSTRPTGSTAVFVVAAEGGGIRAAYWTATVLGRLEERAGGFANRLYVVSGVSGGTLGATVYSALRKDGHQGAALTSKAQEVLSEDFLSPTVAKLVTGDFVQWFLPLPIHQFDRSIAIEEAFSESYRRATGQAIGQSTLTSPITALIPDAARGIPALVMNMTVVETGETAAIAPFTWLMKDVPSARQYTCWVGDCVRRMGDSRPAALAAPNIVQSVHNSARFTYISPAGHVRAVTGASVDHVVDAGYFDPTGADTLLDLIHVLQKGDPATRFVPIYITNAVVKPTLNDAAVTASTCVAGKASTEPSPAPSEDSSRDAPMALLGELFSPVKALIGTRVAHGKLAVARQRADVAAITFGFCEMKKNEDGSWDLPEQGQTPHNLHDPPLGWQLSYPMTVQLDAYERVCAVNQAGEQAVRNWLASSGCGDRN